VYVNSFSIILHDTNAYSVTKAIHARSAKRSQAMPDRSASLVIGNISKTQA
jgi:hypothetical protein